MSERDPDVVRAFDGTGGRGKPRYVEMSVCWAENEREAVRSQVEEYAAPFRTGDGLTFPSRRMFVRAS